MTNDDRWTELQNLLRQYKRAEEALAQLAEKSGQP